MSNASDTRFDNSSPSLPTRLNQMGVWICKISNQPATVWWAANQMGLHPDIEKQIRFELERSSNRFPSVVRKAWHYLFEAWEKEQGNDLRDWHELRGIIRADGWNSATVRKFAAINLPYLKAKKNNMAGPKPPHQDEPVKFRDLVDLDVEFPNQGLDADIPNEWLEPTIREIRKNLEMALILETELGGYGLHNMSYT